MDSKYKLNDAEFLKDDLKKQLKKQLTNSLSDNLIFLRKLFSNSSDFITKKISLFNYEVVLMYCDGMINLQLLGPLVIEPIYRCHVKNPNSDDLFMALEANMIMSNNNNILFNYNDIFISIMSGNIVLLIDGLNKALSIDITGFQSRSIEESINEVDVRSPKEAFVEPIKINLTMLRRRIKSPALKFEYLIVGQKSQTTVAMIYLSDVANSNLLQNIRYKLSKVNLDVLLDSSYLSTFLSDDKYAIFPEIGYTERPDILCGKIAEGRVAILVDGCPHAVIVPHLFLESFQTMDDYTNRPIYTSFMRGLRFLSFFISVFMPGLYVAIASFHPEMFPSTLLFNVAISREVTPFPIIFEALAIHLIYELMREAGLRLPRQVGYAVSIVGALVIGEAAVSSGIIGAPMVIIVAVTAITSFIMTTMYQSVCILKFIFIVLGGLFGLYGIALGGCACLLQLTSMDNFGVPYMAPISPFNLFFMRDTFIRRNWKILGRKNIKVQNMPGAKDM